jgi:hypothetical protein
MSASDSTPWWKRRRNLIGHFGFSADSILDAGEIIDAVPRSDVGTLPSQSIEMDRQPGTWRVSILSSNSFTLANEPRGIVRRVINAKQRSV